MTDEPVTGVPGVSDAHLMSVRSVGDLAAVLRHLRRREARVRGGPQLTYRALAEQTGWSRTMIGNYLSGKTVPPTDRFDALARLLGATGRELGMLATVRDRVEERQRLTADPAQSAKPAETADAYMADDNGEAMEAPLTPAELAPSGQERGTASPVPTNVPSPLTRLIGRDEEAAAIQALVLRADVRVITIVGAPGIGKSRLSTHVAATVAPTFPDGVWYVPLEPISDAELVVPTIAKVLGVKESTGQPLLQSLREFLRQRRLLLLLDNFEHVLEAAPAVAEILTVCPGVKVLATSRAGLHIRGEWLWPVSPLAAPETGPWVSLESAAQFPAVELFVDRARAVQPTFALSETNAGDVCRICADLDGLPLAIELVAARSRTLTPAELVDRLGDRLALLTDGPRDVPPHQRTLRGTIDWSYHLLSPAEQVVFAWLSVFVGGCSLHAAEEVAGPADLPVPVADAVAALADKNLLRIEEGPDGQRYAVMLATIREYALERLESSGDAGPIRERWAAYYLELAQTATEQLGGEQQGRWLRQLDAEQHNLRAVLGWYTEHGNAGDALRMIAASWRFWHIRFRQAEGLRWVEQVLTMPGHQDERVRAEVLCGAGWLAVDQYDRGLANSFFTESLAAYRKLGDQRGMADALHGVGTVELCDGDAGQAASLFEESLHHYREAGDDEGVAWSLDHVGSAILELGSYGMAEQHFAEALVIFRRLRHSWGMALALHHLGLSALALGRCTDARGVFDEALAIFTELDNSWGVAICLLYLGHVALDSGEHDTAEANFAQALHASYAQADRPGAARALAGLASLAVSEGNLVRAAQLFRRAETLAEASGIRMNPATRARYERDTELVRSMLGSGPPATLMKPRLAVRSCPSSSGIAAGARPGAPSLACLLPQGTGMSHGTGKAGRARGDSLYHGRVVGGGGGAGVATPGSSRSACGDVLSRTFDG
jgi:predicted ATPase/transcriptional regulator with XRE-family HTH domain